MNPHNFESKKVSWRKTVDCIESMATKYLELSMAANSTCGNFFICNSIAYPYLSKINFVCYSSLWKDPELFIKISRKYGTPGNTQIRNAIIVTDFFSWPLTLKKSCKALFWCHFVKSSSLALYWVKCQLVRLSRSVRSGSAQFRMAQSLLSRSQRTREGNGCLDQCISINPKIDPYVQYRYTRCGSI